MRITVEQAARVMGVTPQFIRVAIQKGVLDIGTCVKLGKGKKKYTYLIVKSKLAKYLGLSIEELERRIPSEED